MTEAVIQPGRRLGRNAPSNKPALMLSSILKVVPAHPSTINYLADVNDFELYGNDQYGDCGPVSVGNSLKLITKEATGVEVSVTLDDIFDLYRRSGNPDFDPATDADDNGVVMQDMLKALLDGGIAGRKPVAFAKVDVTNLDEVRAAVAYFGCVLFGVNLEVAQRQQTDLHLWDYVSSSEWGGHAVMCGAYTSIDVPHTPDFTVVTWGDEVGVTDAFCVRQLEEAWVVVWPEHLSHPAFLAGVDIAALALAYSTLTDRPLPLPEPDPIPSPTPSPTPGAACFPGSLPAVDAKIVALAARHQMTTSDYLNWLLGRLFHLGTAVEFGAAIDDLYESRQL